MRTRIAMRRGFTLLETMVVSGLTGVLVLMVAASWRGLGRPLSDAITQSQISQEANLTVATLARDISGSCLDLAQDTKKQKKGKTVGVLIPNASQFLLCIDEGNPPNGTADWAAPDIVLRYEVQSNRLVRISQTQGTTTTIAKYVESLLVRNVSAGTELKLTFKYRDVSRTYTFVTKNL